MRASHEWILKMVSVLEIQAMETWVGGIRGKKQE